MKPWSNSLAEQRASDLAEQPVAKTRWTLAEIKAANEAAGFYFFSRNTMRFFGDTMRSFAVRHIDGKVYIQRVRRPRNAPQGYQWAGELREFHPDTGDIDIARNDK